MDGSPARAYLNDDDFTLHVGDAATVLRTLPGESVHMCCTSPPFYGLRDYEVDGQIGLEESPEEWVERLVEVFREVRRVLRGDGTLWIECGDSYASSWPCRRRNVIGEGSLPDGRREARPPRLGGDLKDKDLIGGPWLLAFALRADGWWLRSNIIWDKANAMPESVYDRPTSAHSHIFLLSKSARYFYDAEAIREEAPWERWGDQTPGKYEDHESKGALVKYRSKRPDGWASHDGAHGSIHREGREKGDFAELVARGRNKRTVWRVATEPYADAHYATWPTKLVQPMILAGTSERGVCPACGAPWKRVVTKGKGDAEFIPGVGGRKDHRGRPDGGQQEWDAYVAPQTLGWEAGCECARVLNRPTSPIPATVLDPFMGSGTTAYVARTLGRRAIGIELNEEYAEQSARRTRQLSLFA